MKGYFLDGSIRGLAYQTPSGAGRLDDSGCFEYQKGESVTFSLGGIVLGTCMAGDHVSPLDMVYEARGRRPLVSHYEVENMTRLLMGLGEIGADAEAAVSSVRHQLDFVLEPADFEASFAVVSILEQTGAVLPQAAYVRNVLRRSDAGILKERDVQIPVRDGGYVLADVYRPLAPGRYPVVMCMGVFGKEFINGFIDSEDDEQYRQEAEDRFYGDFDSVETKRMLQGIFFGRMGACFGSALPVPNPDPDEIMEGPAGPPPKLVPVSEAFEQPCALDWVPYGYAVINIEERGTGKNMHVDLFKQFGARNAKDYCDAIEWAAVQPWSTGKIGLFGASYYAMTQYLAAQRKPKGLTAMIPIMGDYDSYRDYIYSGGGLFNRADNMDPCRKPQPMNFMKKAMEEPFWNEETYGPEGEYMSSCDIKKIDLPIYISVEPDASLHAKGSSEAFINCASEEKKLMILNSCGIHFWMYNSAYLAKFRAFFDHWLKGEDNGIMDEAPVQMQIRTGNGSFYWKEASDWPVPGTTYQKYYLNAQPPADIPDADAPGYAAEGAVMGSLGTDVPEDGVTGYNADVYHKSADRVPGATFISAPFEKDTEIAGYIKAGLYVASTTEDMEIHMRVRVLDEYGEEVIYPAPTSMETVLPLGFGALLVSHREQDPDRTRPELPVYRHTKEAWKPLVPGEVTYCEIGTFPTTGLIRKGWRLRLDLDPVNFRWINYQEEHYRKGAVNTIYSGENCPSFVQLPVIG